MERVRHRQHRASVDALGVWNVEAAPFHLVGGLWVPQPVQRQHNLVVNAGKDMLRDLLFGDVLGGLTTFKVGTNATAVVVGDTALNTSVFSDVLTARTKSSQSLTVKYYLGTLSANGNTLREAGIFNASTTMYARVVLGSPIVKTSSVIVTFTWTLTW